MHEKRTNRSESNDDLTNVGYFCTIKYMWVRFLPRYEEGVHYVRGGVQILCFRVFAIVTRGTCPTQPRAKSKLFWTLFFSSKATRLNGPPTSLSWLTNREGQIARKGEVSLYILFDCFNYTKLVTLFKFIISKEGETKQTSIKLVFSAQTANFVPFYLC